MAGARALGMRHIWLIAAPRRPPRAVLPGRPRDPLARRAGGPAAADERSAIRGRHHRGRRGQPPAPDGFADARSRWCAVAGVPLIESVLAQLRDRAGSRPLTIIVNEQERGVRRAGSATRFPALDDRASSSRPRASSLESFREVTGARARRAACWSPRSTRGARRRTSCASSSGRRARPADATVLAVTPVRRRREAAVGRRWRPTAACRRSAAAAGDLVTAGMYVVPERCARLAPAGEPRAAARLPAVAASTAGEPLYGGDHRDGGRRRSGRRTWPRGGAGSSGATDHDAVEEDGPVSRSDLLGNLPRASALAGPRDRRHGDPAPDRQASGGARASRSSSRPRRRSSPTEAPPARRLLHVRARWKCSAQLARAGSAAACRTSTRRAPCSTPIATG